jgi:hypothetical protein
MWVSSLCNPATDASGHPARRKELMSHEELFIALHDHVSPEMIYEGELLICRL